MPCYIVVSAFPLHAKPGLTSQSSFLKMLRSPKVVQECGKACSIWMETGPCTGVGEEAGNTLPSCSSCSALGGWALTHPSVPPTPASAAPNSADSQPVSFFLLPPQVHLPGPHSQPPHTVGKSKYPKRQARFSCGGMAAAPWERNSPLQPLRESWTPQQLAPAGPSHIEVLLLTVAQLLPFPQPREQERRRGGGSGLDPRIFPKTARLTGTLTSLSPSLLAWPNLQTCHLHTFSFHSYPSPTSPVSHHPLRKLSLTLAGICLL